MIHNDTVKDRLKGLYLYYTLTKRTELNQSPDLQVLQLMKVNQSRGGGGPDLLSGV